MIAKRADTFLEYIICLFVAHFLFAEMGNQQHDARQALLARIVMVGNGARNRGLGR